MREFLENWFQGVDPAEAIVDVFPITGEPLLDAQLHGIDEIGIAVWTVIQRNVPGSALIPDMKNRDLLPSLDHNGWIMVPWNRIDKIVIGRIDNWPMAWDKLD